MPLVETRVEDVAPQVAALYKGFREGTTRPLAWRRHQLKQLRLCLEKHLDEWNGALRRDLGKSAFMSELGETKATIKEIDHFLANLDSWVADEKRSVPLLTNPAKAFMRPEPYGVVCIIAPWNYPVRLLLFPLIGAIAAGNATVVKPSEVAEHTAELVTRLLPQYMDMTCLKVINGGVPPTSELLKQKFDLIFYTGNGMVGRLVMKAAAEHLTPVVLELGGKSPCIVDKSANLAATAKRIVWGKTMNCGQTCVAPDYVLVEESVEQPLVEALKATFASFYPDGAQKSDDFSRIINNRHFQRVVKLMKGENVVYGGDTDEKELFISPTIISNPRVDSEVMRDEIFGPLLPIIRVKSVEAAISFVNDRDKPLALYVFAEDKSVVERVINSTSAGGVGVNETISHIACPDMPFGGVGPSGMGRYNGKSSFETFTHMKPVLTKPTAMDADVRYPPYTPFKRNLVSKLFFLELPDIDFKFSVWTAVAIGALAYAYYK